MDLAYAIFGVCHFLRPSIQSNTNSTLHENDHPLPVTRSLLSAAAIPLLATGLRARLPNPLINIDASGLTEEGQPLAGPIANTGTLGGTFATDGPTVDVATTSGKKSSTFTGGNRLKADFTAPSGIAGNGTYTVVATVLNPAIGNQEAYLSWSRRYPAVGFNAGVLTAATRISVRSPTGPGRIGFTTLPPANLWHTIAVTYDGTTEKIYVNGALNAQENKTLNMYQAILFSSAARSIATIQNKIS